MENRSFSFEFFPPKTVAGQESLKKVWQELSAKQPDFFSVTYGAGGSTRSNTLETVAAIQAENLPVAPHISFGGDDEQTIATMARQYQDMGITRLVALRGDIPSGMGPMLRHANELVAFLRAETGEAFDISVAAYPEIHPQAPDYNSDIDFLKNKLDAGANSAITQYFYNADAFLYFIDRCHAAGIDKPIIPGIMPIINFDNLCRFSKACGTEIPRWIGSRITGFGEDQESIRAFGVEVVTKLCERLLSYGAPGLHFYTMNKSAPLLEIWENLGLDSHRASQ